MSNIDVLILMGSDSDAPVMQAAADVLKELGLTWDMTVASAHRSPDRVERLVSDAPSRGVSLFIVGAGAAAHLAGVVADMVARQDGAEQHADDRTGAGAGERHHAEFEAGHLR